MAASEPKMYYRECIFALCVDSRMFRQKVACLQGVSCSCRCTHLFTFNLQCTVLSSSFPFCCLSCSPQFKQSSVSGEQLNRRQEVHQNELVASMRELSVYNKTTTTREPSVLCVVTDETTGKRFNYSLPFTSAVTDLYVTIVGKAGGLELVQLDIK